MPSTATGWGIPAASRTVGAPAETYRELIKDLASQRVHAMEKLKWLDSVIEKEVNTHPYGQVLLSFPGFGPITGAIVISGVKDISRWADKRKLKKAFGLYAYMKQSGTSLSRVKRGKEGNRYARSLLFQACLRIISCRTPESDFKDYYLRQLAMGKTKMKALISTEAKLVEVIFYCLKNGKCYKYQGKYLPAHRHLLSSSATQKQ